ncbi:MAG: twin-arginine translocation signal domain-containing protein [Nanohaloarchaea archaeon]|nr:twin-arginine translocation signal domain-containing protein [Candidatus Nanohaloarchaea archaeon]
MKDEKYNRRKFLKFLGQGTALLGLALSPLSPLSSILDNIGEGSDLNNVEKVRQDPQNPSKGDLWFREDLA